MKITPVSVTFINPATRKSETRLVSSLTANSFTDCPAQKRVFVQFNETIFPMLLWDGDSYDTAGQYTDVDIDARVKQIVSNNPIKAINDLFKNPISPLDREEIIIRHKAHKLALNERA